MARERQIEFPPNRTHDPRATTYTVGLSVVCVVIVVILLLLDVEGPFIGPW